MKFVLTLAALVAISTSAHAAPATPAIPTAADIAFANKAGDAAAATVAKFHRAGGVSYRSDPIGARISAAKPVRAAKSKSKPTTLAAAFTPAFMASLKKR